MSKLRLIKFGADYCPPCQQMKKRGTLEAFEKEHADVQVVQVDIESKKGGTLADEYGVRAIPVLVFEKDGVELARSEGAVNARELDKLYEKAAAKVRKNAALDDLDETEVPIKLTDKEKGEMDARRRALWASQPAVNRKDRKSIIAWLQWNDPNGEYSDAEVERDGGEPLSLEDLLDLFDQAVAEA